MLRRRAAAQLARLCYSAAVSFCVLVIACGSRGEPNGAVTVGGRGIPFDSVFPLRQTTPLIAPANQIIGNAVFGTVAASGDILLADAAMGDVKVFDRQGRFRQAIGKRGRGPGEFVLPVSVSQSPFDGRLVVTDLQARRVTFFDGRSLSYLGLKDLAAPVGFRAAILGHSDTVLVTGAVSNPEEATPHAAALMDGNSRVVSNLLPIPTRMRHRAYLENFIHGMVDQTPAYIYLQLEGDGRIFRISYSGAVVDSLLIPPAIYPGFTLPQHQLGSDSAVREYFKTEPMARGITVLNDSTIVVEVQGYSTRDNRFRQTMIAIFWGIHPSALALTPCDCRLLGSRGDTLAVLLGETPDSLKVEWRSLRRPAE